MMHPSLRGSRFVALTALLAAMLARPLQAQSAQGIEVAGLAGQRRIVSLSDLAAMPRREVRASAHQVSGTFAGVSLADVLRLVNAPSGDSLRGPALATYVLVEAADGYRVVFALAEFDGGFTDRVALLADHKDGALLTARDGPFQLVIPDEKRPARWVRQVRRIRLLRAPVEP